MSKKINLIYIASNGRSGSTLLEKILNDHNNIISLGEFQEYINNYKNKKKSELNFIQKTIYFLFFKLSKKYF